MKLATYRNGTRDGQLMVVSRNLNAAVAVPAIASCMQELLDNWDGIAPKLEKSISSLTTATWMAVSSSMKLYVSRLYLVRISGLMAVPM